MSKNSNVNKVNNYKTRKERFGKSILELCEMLEAKSKPLNPKTTGQFNYHKFQNYINDSKIVEQYLLVIKDFKILKSTNLKTQFRKLYTEAIRRTMNIIMERFKEETSRVMYNKHRKVESITEKKFNIVFGIASIDRIISEELNIKPLISSLNNLKTNNQMFKKINEAGGVLECPLIKKVYLEILNDPQPKNINEIDKIISEYNKNLETVLNNTETPNKKIEAFVKCIMIVSLLCLTPKKANDIINGVLSKTKRFPYLQLLIESNKTKVNKRIEKLQTYANNAKTGNIDDNNFKTIFRSILNDATGVILKSYKYQQKYVDINPTVLVYHAWAKVTFYTGDQNPILPLLYTYISGYPRGSCVDRAIYLLIKILAENKNNMESQPVLKVWQNHYEISTMKNKDTASFREWPNRLRLQSPRFGVNKAVIVSDLRTIIIILSTAAMHRHMKNATKNHSETLAYFYNKVTTSNVSKAIREMVWTRNQSEMSFGPLFMNKD